MMQLNFPTTVPGILVYLVGLVILWVVISIPVYFASKAVTVGKSDFGDAMGATLGGAIGYFVVLYTVSYFLGAVIGSSADALALILALFVWLAIFRASFRTSWLRAIAIVLLSWVFLLVIDVVVRSVLGVSFPSFFPFL